MLHYSLLKNKLHTLDYPTVTNNKQITYYNIEAGFDIETTSMKSAGGEKFAYMYVWMVGIGYGEEVYYGNTWEEFVDFCEALSNQFNLTDKKLFVIYVHNLGYEFQFMHKYFTWTDVFSGGERKPLKATTSLGIEFRDSYILSGYSLANTAKNLVKHKVAKMVGDLDYTLIRTPSTPLTEKEIKYCENDIHIILAYINEQIDDSGSIAQIPMTNTGRVRKFTRDQCYYKNIDGSKGNKAQYVRYRKLIADLTLDVASYTQLKRAFMGGFTHANANHSGVLLEGVSSIDFTSSYPSVMLSEKFPMSRFKATTVDTLSALDALCNRYAVVFDARFENIKAALTQENYISESKCFNVINPTINNGRINCADSISVTITDIDYEIMKQAYTWDEIEVTNVKYAHKDYLPKPIINSVLKLYQGKTELKDVAGSEIEYMHSKGMLNSIYGMCVTDVVKTQASYSNETWSNEIPNVAETIMEYNESKNRFLYYPWGVWITAYARRNLWTGIVAVGDDYVYSDTDSLKVFNYETHKPYIEWFDKTIIAKMETMCDHYKIDKQLLRPKTKEGVEKIIGVWDFEGTYSRFKTLGAKRYLTEANGKLHLTVAGLSKRNGIEHMKAQALGDIDGVFDLFDDELYIPAEKTGKMTHTYIDQESATIVTDYLGGKTTVNSLSGIHLENCEFTLSISDRYLSFMSQLNNGYIFKGVKYK